MATGKTMPERTHSAKPAAEKTAAWQQYEVQEPYPEIRAEQRNPMYARAMLDNMGGSDSEMSTVSLYFYNHLITHDREEIALAFHKISIVEMHHLEIFGALALQLGADPRLWTDQGRRKSYWTPGYNRYPRCLKCLLNNAIEGEKRAIAKYRRQCGWIRDTNIVANLERILLDEEAHVRILEHLQADCTQEQKT